MLAVALYGIASAAAAAATLPCPGGVGSPADLVSAIDRADTLTGPNVIELAPACNYSFSAPDTSSKTVGSGGTLDFDDWYGPSALPAIATNITIRGNGATLQRSEGGPPFRLFFVGANPAASATPNWTTPGAGSLTLEDLTLRQGEAEGGSVPGGGGGGLGAGGAIYDQGVLTLQRVTLIDDVAIGGVGGHGIGGPGGGMDPTGAGSGFGDGFTPPPGASAGNPAGGGGGIADGEPGAGIEGGGGGQFGTGTGGEGGGGFETAGAVGGDASGGGGLPGAESGLVAAGGGFGNGGTTGATNIEILTGGLTGDTYGGGGGGGGTGGGGGGGGGASGLKHLAGGAGGGGGFGGGGGNGGDRGGEFSGGHGGFGGGGGGIWPENDGRAPAPGGFGAGEGVEASFGGGGAGMGGAVFVHNGTLLAVNSTFFDDGAFGGGVSSGGTATAGSGLGGAVFDLDGTVTSINSTFARGAADSATAIYALGYDAFRTHDPATVALENTIVSGEGAANEFSANDLVAAAPPTEIAPNIETAAVNASEPNIIGSTSIQIPATILGSPLSQPPLFSAFADNGGPGMQTLALSPGSPALGAGDRAVAPSTDERGVPRLPCAPVDLGAVQVSSPVGGSCTSPGSGPGGGSGAGTSGTGPVIPSLTRLRESSRRWREGPRAARLTAIAQLPIGTTFSFALNVDARVTLTFVRQASGRSVRRTCAPRTPRNAKKLPCIRKVAAGTLGLLAHEGTNRIYFAGGLSSHTKLKPGNYTLTISATTTQGRVSRAGPIAFAVVK